jgi:hypothetical protein
MLIGSSMIMRRPFSRPSVLCAKVGPLALPLSFSLSKPQFSSLVFQGIIPALAYLFPTSCPDPHYTLEQLFATSGVLKLSMIAFSGRRIACLDAS